MWLWCWYNKVYCAWSNLWFLKCTFPNMKKSLQWLSQVLLYWNANLSNQNVTVRIYEEKNYLASADLAEARKKDGTVTYCFFLKIKCPFLELERFYLQTPAFKFAKWICYLQLFTFLKQNIPHWVPIFSSVKMTIHRIRDHCIFFFK